MSVKQDGQDGPRKQHTWNTWLEERDQAPGELLTEWLKEKTLGGLEKTLEGLEAAQKFAKAGLEIAKSRADVARAGGALLDSGGPPAKEAISMKQQVNQAVAIDAGMTQALVYFSKHYREESAFETDPALSQAYSRRAALYTQALEALGSAPEAMTMTPVERDAAAILRFGDAAARGISLEGGGSSLASWIASGYNTDNIAMLSASREEDASFEGMLQELFRLHDLNGDGTVTETELVKLNQKIAQMHHGKDCDKDAVRQKFSAIFRRNLDANGRPVGYASFREHTVKMLRDFDPSQPAQEMILEQFITEARLARAAFHHSAFASFTDAEFLPHLQADRPEELSPLAESPAADDDPYATRASGEATSSTRAPLGTSLCSSRQGTSSALAPPDNAPQEDNRPESKVSEVSTTERKEQERAVTGGYATKDPVQVWSNSKKIWLDGVVVQAFSTDCEFQGYAVPAGSLKVSSSAGTKWIRPGEASKALRLMPH